MSGVLSLSVWWSSSLISDRSIDRWEDDGAGSRVTHSNSFLYCCYCACGPSGVVAVAGRWKSSRRPRSRSIHPFRRARTTYASTLWIGSDQTRFPAMFIDRGREKTLLLSQLTARRARMAQMCTTFESRGKMPCFLRGLHARSVYTLCARPCTAHARSLPPARQGRDALEITSCLVFLRAHHQTNQAAVSTTTETEIVFNFTRLLTGVTPPCCRGRASSRTRPNSPSRTAAHRLETFWNKARFADCNTNTYERAART